MALTPSMNPKPEINCQLCGKVPIEGAIPSESLRPRPIYTCGNCGRNNSEVVRQYDFPIFHYRNGFGLWYFVFLDKDDRPFLYSFDYGQRRPRRFPSWTDITPAYEGWLSNDFPGFVRPLYPMKSGPALEKRDGTSFGPFSGFRGLVFCFIDRDGKRYSIASCRDYNSSMFMVEDLKKSDASIKIKPYDNPRELYVLDNKFVAEYIEKQSGLYYFAYGADMDRQTFPSQLYPGDYKKLPDHARVIKGILYDYRPSFSRYSFLWKGGMLDLTEDSGECAQGVIYDLRGKEMSGFLFLDSSSEDCFSYSTLRLGGVAKYIHIDVWVEGDDGTYPAKMFCSGNRNSAYVKPSQEYLDLAIKGANAFYGLSEYTHRLTGLANGYSCTYRDGSHRFSNYSNDKCASGHEKKTMRRPKNKKSPRRHK